jgi:hypothetical protein
MARAKLQDLSGGSMALMYSSFCPGQVWLDTNGNPIQAHGGGVIYNQGIYYWFGEDKGGQTQLDLTKGFLHRMDVIGIHCYSSTDLYNWKDEGIVLPAVPGDPEHDLHPSKVAERPKVVYNAATKKYVMWLHIDSTDYAYAQAGVAISDRPTGPYQYLGSLRPNGAMSRDMTLFKDEDNQVYHLFSSEHNRTMHISRLTPDYLQPSGDEARIFEDLSREAPAIFKHAGRYYIISSGCTGWDPNPAVYAAASTIFGPWQIQGNPCVGPGAEVTYQAQSTYILPVAGMPGKYIFMADIWKKENLGDSRYVWLPLTVDGDRVLIEWLDEWDLSIFKK